MNVKTGKVIFNENKVKMLGYSKKDFQEVDYTAFTDLVHPDDYEKTMKAMKDHLDGNKKLYEIEYRIKTKNGEYKWFHDRGSIVKKDKNGKPLNVKGVVFDITNLKRTEIKLKNLNDNLEKLVSERTKELQKSNEKLKNEIFERIKAEEYSNRAKQNLRNIIDSASELIISFDMNNRISIWNKKAEKTTGYKQIEVINRSVGKLEVFNNSDNILENIKDVCGKKISKFFDIILNTKDKNKRVIRVTGTEIKSSNNECVGALFIGSDITKEIELHKKLLGGNSYLIAERNNKSSIDLLADLIIDEFIGLIITRGNPDQIKRQIPSSKNIEIVILTKEKVKGLKNLTNLEELKDYFNNFVKKTDKPVILLDGLHYLISRYSFEDFIKLLYDLNDIVAIEKAILFVRIDPSTIDSNQMALIENELLVLPSQKTEDIIIEDDIYDIIKYIFQQNNDNAIVSVKKVMNKFKITYVTAASRISSLELKALIYTKKQGKIRALFLTEKGKKLLNKRKTA